jgi:hypothetical protein
MPEAKILKRLIYQLTQNGMDKKKATAVAISKMRKAGNIKKNSLEATDKGKKRGDMTPAQRAKDRAAKSSGGKASDYKYNRNNNTAVKGKVNKKVKKRK